MHGRYSHAQPYVVRILSEHGLEPAIRYADLRMESGIPVAGLVVLARRVDADAQ
jgi:predicted TPR repeat methyltransferase